VGGAYDTGTPSHAHCFSSDVLHLLAYYRVVFSYLNAGRIPSQRASEQTSKRTSFFFHPSPPNSGLPRTKIKIKEGHANLNIWLKSIIFKSSPSSPPPAPLPINTGQLFAFLSDACLPASRWLTTHFLDPAFSKRKVRKSN